MPVCCVCRVLKPFIKRDTGIQPLKVKLLQEIIAYPHRYSATWLLCLMPIHTGIAPRGFCVSCLSTQVQHHMAFVPRFYPRIHTGTVPCGFSVPCLSGFSVPCLSGFSVPCLSGFCVSCLSGFSVPCLSGFSVPCLSGFCVSCLSGFSVPCLSGFCVSCLSTHPHRYSATWLLCPMSVWLLCPMPIWLLCLVPIWLLCLVPIHTGTVPCGFCVPCLSSCCVSCLSTQVQYHVAFVSHAYPHRYSATWL